MLRSNRILPLLTFLLLLIRCVLMTTEYQDTESRIQELVEELDLKRKQLNRLHELFEENKGEDDECDKYGLKMQKTLRAIIRMEKELKELNSTSTKLNANFTKFPDMSSVKLNASSTQLNASSTQLNVSST